MIEVHPNTVRFYEAVGLLPPIPRKPNGYRAYGERHLRQLRLIQTALRSGILSDNLRKEAIHVLKASARGDIDGAIRDAKKYLQHIEAERQSAYEAVDLAKSLLDSSACSGGAPLNRPQAAAQLGITKDILRDWQRNGLVCAPHDEKGQLAFGEAEMNRLKIIRTLRNAHYSQMAILRMLRKAEKGAESLRAAIDTPDPEEDIVYVTDRYLSSLGDARKDAQSMLIQLSAF